MNKELFTLESCAVAGIVGKATEVRKDGVVYMIPTSQVSRIHPCNTKITITAWIAKQKGLI